MWTAWLLLTLNGLFFTLRLAGNTGSFPRALTREEEQDCLERMAQGDTDARDKLIEHNLRLVAHIVKKYYTPNGDQDDLISIGTIGLIKGVSTFKPDKNVRLATYASRCIENATLSQCHALAPKRNITLAASVPSGPGLYMMTRRRTGGGLVTALLYVHSFKPLLAHTFWETERMAGTNPETLVTTADKLRYCRHVRGLEQQEVAAYVGLHRIALRNRSILSLQTSAVEPWSRSLHQLIKFAVDRVLETRDLLSRLSSSPTLSEREKNNGGRKTPVFIVFHTQMESISSFFCLAEQFSFFTLAMMASAWACATRFSNSPVFLGVCTTILNPHTVSSTTAPPCLGAYAAVLSIMLPHLQPEGYVNGLNQGGCPPII